jgi:hypothetical protein
MKTKYLIDLLKKFDPDSEVIVAAFFDDNTAEICEVDMIDDNGGPQLSIIITSK